LTGYKDYKKTSEFWLSSIPDNWDNIKIKHIFKERVEKGYPDKTLLASTQNMGVVPKNVYGNRTVEASKDFHLLKLVKTGDFVISLRSFQGGIEYAYYEGIISPAYTVMIPDKNNPYFFRYLFKSIRFIELLQNCVTGIREGQNIDYSKLREHLIPIPQRPEQDQIVRYLDWKVSMINKYINVNKKQIELLKERILFYLQKSLESNDTKLMRLKNIVKNEFDEIIRNENTLYTPIGVLNRGRGIFHKPSLLGCNLGDSIFHWVKNDVLVFSGQFAWEGAIALSSDSESDCIASHRYYTLRANKEIVLNSYLWAFFVSQDGDMLINKNSIGAAGRNRPLNINSLLKESIPVPPMKHQIILDKYIAEYFNLVKFTKQNEVFLNEYRTRLISDVVTGKVNVQNVKVPEFEAENEVLSSIECVTEGDTITDE